MPKKFRLRYVLLVVIIVAAAVFFSSNSSDVQVDANMGACEILDQNPNWKLSLKKAQDKYNLSPAFAMGLIYQESRFDAEAKSSYSTAYGYAQAINSTWQHFQEEVKQNAKRNNFDDSVQFIGWYMAQLSKSLKLKMSDSENLYMAYMLGATGYKRYKAGTFKNKAKIEEDKNIANKVKAYTNLYKSQLKDCKI
ncbi:transglycosylase SLT domain-containing protein [Francisella sp. XLW-1]|uniref:transglycosylase SLT domain-containing protein n=1 Tax=Francisella sp. XLW-1 TaxID=2610887 RepID=UPI00123CEFFB|nr:transglycosylase SLT domain-containing protein [Francisella sp. XLW-1]